MILGHAPEHEILRAVPVGRAEFPERIADRIEAGSGHVDRAEAAVRGPVRRAELLRPEARQRLHLVAAREERELLGIGRADMREAFAQQIKRVVPRNRVVDAVAPLAAGTANHRVLQLRLRILLHDARAALGAEHALIHHVIRVALDEAYVRLTRLAGFPGSFFRRHLDAAAAGAHVAGGVMHLLLAAILETDRAFASGRQRNAASRDVRFE